MNANKVILTTSTTIICKLNAWSTIWRILFLNVVIVVIIIIYIDLRVTEESFRQLLMTMENEHRRLQKANACLEDAVTERDALIIDMNREKDRKEERVAVMEKEIRLLREKNSLYLHEKQELANEVCLFWLAFYL